MNENQGFNISNNDYCSSFPHFLYGIIVTKDILIYLQIEDLNVETAPNKFLSLQNHPNPLNLTMKINYKLPKN